MPTTILPLWPAEPPEWNAANTGPKPEMELHLLPGDAVRPLVVVFPGGGYNGLAAHEAEPYAQAANGWGCHAVVVRYRTQWHGAPRPLGTGPLRDAEQAIRIVRAHAGEWHVNPDRIAVIGSSAGGHLACTVSVHGGTGEPNAEGALARLSGRPNAAILCYAVITSKAFRHGGSMENLCGAGDPEGRAEFFSLDRHVTSQTPPMFLWHTADDGVVPVENSLLLAMALRAAKVDFELHVFAHGAHGLGLAADRPDIAAWVGLCGTWLGGVLGR